LLGRQLGQAEEITGNPISLDQNGDRSGIHVVVPEQGVCDLGVIDHLVLRSKKLSQGFSPQQVAALMLGDEAHRVDRAHEALIHQVASFKDRTARLSRC